MPPIQLHYGSLAPGSWSSRWVWHGSIIPKAIVLLAVAGLVLSVRGIGGEASPSQPVSPPLSLAQASPMVVDQIEQSVRQAQPLGPSVPVLDSFDEWEMLESAEILSTYDHRLVRATGTMTMVVTAYCAGPCCCGKFADGITASGKKVGFNGGKLVAADTRVLPFGSMVSIPGYASDQPVPVLDRGGAIKGHRLDLLMPTHAQAKQWGRRTVEVTVWEFVP